MALRIGDHILGSWKIEEVRTGGMGTVYIAVHPADRSERIAVKSIRQDYLSNPTIRTQFEHEANVWIDLGFHRHIITAHQVINLEGGLGIVLEYAEHSLRSRLGTAGIGLSKSLEYGVEICAAMDYAFSKSALIHRDLKPENIMCTMQRDSFDDDDVKVFDVIKVTDFGLAVLTSEKTKSYAGTPPYMAPEQFETTRVGTTADIYAFGIILFEMLSGRRPFVARSAREYQTLHQNAVLPSLHILDSSIPKEVEQVVSKCLQKKPEDRYQTFGELKQELLQLSYTPRVGPVNWIRGDVDIDLLVDRLYLPREFPDNENEQTVLAMTAAAFGMEDMAMRWAKVGMSLAELARDKEAIPLLQKALQFLPEDAPDRDVLWSNLGTCLFKIGRLAEAIDSLRRAIELSPDDHISWNTMGACYRELGQFGPARACFERALAEQPGYRHALQNLSALETSEEDMLERYAQAIQLDPGNADHYYNRGTTYAGLGQYDNALVDYSRAIQLNPEFMEAYANRGSTYAALQRYDEALADYERAIQLDSSDPFAHVGTGMVFLACSDPRRALPYFDRAASLGDPQGRHLASKVRSSLGLRAH